MARFRNCYEIVDEAWLCDCLSDDDVEISHADDVFADESPQIGEQRSILFNDVIHICYSRPFLIGVTIHLSPRSLRTIISF